MKLKVKANKDKQKGDVKMIFDESYTLSNGVVIPKLGFGTWFIDDDRVVEAVCSAVEIGYRSIDTAQAYDNERGVGEGVRKCGLSRDQIFVTSKVGAEHKSYDGVAWSIGETLGRMGLDYLDLMIIHSPQPWEEWRGERRYFEENRQAWRALEDAYKAGKVRAIGVSNFLIDDLESLLPYCEIKPMVNQILVHAGNTPKDLIAFCASQNIQIESYSPMGHGEVLNSGILREVACRYGVSVAQLCIRYVLQLGTVALPKTGNPVHMKDNASVDFEISSQDMELLSSLENVTDYGQYGYFPVFSRK